MSSNDTASVQPNIADVLAAMKEAILDAMPSNELRLTVKEILEFRSSLNGESDRGASLMAGAFLDEKLKLLLKNRLVEDKKVTKAAFEHRGALGSFSSRIDFSYLVGLLPKSAHRDLHLIREIRNDFGHVAGVISFDDHTIAQRCKELTFGAMALDASVASARSRFNSAVMGVLGIMTTATIQMVRLEPKVNPEVPDGRSSSELVKLIARITGADISPFGEAQ